MRPLLPLLLLGALGLAELAADFTISAGAPSLADFESVRGELAASKRPGDFVAVAPRWAEPLARAAFGDELMPLREVARPDDSIFERAIEVGVHGATYSGLDAWTPSAERSYGKVRFRILRNPRPIAPAYSFVDMLADEGAVFVERRGAETPCTWRSNARAETGGLHGHVAYPRERFECPGQAPYFVGVTVIDDQEYRPRRCIWAHPPRRGVLVLHFQGVPLGERISGYAGLSYFLFRDGGGAPVELEVSVDGRSLGRYVHHDERGWSEFSFATQGAAGKRASVEFRVRGGDARQRHFCFYADTR
jgi:hypothetical protein